jgi:hypothetical protein
MKTTLPTGYSTFILKLKERIHKAQYTALKAVNKELIAYRQINCQQAG